MKKSDKKKLVEDTIKLLKKQGLYDNVTIVYDNTMIQASEADFNVDKMEYIYPEEKITTNESISCENYDGNNDTIVVIYDGGSMYSAMNGEYGWGSKDKFESEFNKIIKPYNLYVEEIDHVSFSLWDN